MTEVISVVNLLRNFMYLSAEVKVCIVTLLFASIFSLSIINKERPLNIFELSAK